MSNVPQDVLQQLVQVLANLVSNDNAVRSAAEEQLNNEWMVKSPDALLSGFAYLSRHSEEADLRSFAAVLTRRVAFKGIPNQDPEAEEVTLWDVTQEQTRQAMKTHFLEGLSQESNKSVRNKICDTIAEMARASSLKG
ncbi:Importin-5, partial [Lobosporangium transversale]